MSESRSRARVRPKVEGGPSTAGPRKVLGVPLPEEIARRVERLAARHMLRPATVGRHLIIGALDAAERDGLRLAEAPVVQSA